MAAVIINPNSTAAMTNAMTDVARRTVPQIAFEGWTSHKAPAAIQGPEDGQAAESHLLELVQQADEQKAEAIIIGCFDDTALKEAARLATCPVIGLGQASYHLAALRNWHFSVITTLAESVPILEHNIRSLGLEKNLGKVRASGVEVLALHKDPDFAEQRVVEEAQSAVREDGIDAIVLGCAGMSSVTRSAREKVHAEIIDPVEAAAKSLNWLI